MSDGNFNTKLLAPGGYASGVRAGEARMKQLALKTLGETLEAAGNMSQEDKDSIIRTFKVRLDASTLGK